MIQEDCDWWKKRYCQSPECQDKDCDLHNLPYEEKAINKRAKEEMKWIKENKKDSKKKKELIDKLMGLKVLSEAYRKIKRTK